MCVCVCCACACACVWYRWRRVNANSACPIESCVHTTSDPWEVVKRWTPHLRHIALIQHDAPPQPSSGETVRSGDVLLLVVRLVDEWR